MHSRVLSRHLLSRYQVVLHWDNALIRRSLDSSSLSKKLSLGAGPGVLHDSPSVTSAKTCFWYDVCRVIIMIYIRLYIELYTLQLHG